MKLFADTADLTELKELKELGLVNGVTTNPQIISHSGKNLLKILGSIVDLLPNLPVVGMVVATDTKTMIKEARMINSIGPNMIIKLPATIEATKAIPVLAEENIKVCSTCIVTAAQAVLAAKAGAAYTALFTGQLDIIGYKGVDTLRDIVNIYGHFNLKTQVIAASVKKPQDIVDYALVGAHIITIPYQVFMDAFS
ncbi:MAG TPA: transaldolase family protein, partial [Nitrososphaera sp.]|nr:transaldolase family protein [Nitrososphaera sp.]